MDVSSLRTPAVAHVLDTVRETGLSAFPPLSSTSGIGPAVSLASIRYGLNPVQAQAEVTSYADALDAQEV